MKLLHLIVIQVWVLITVDVIGATNRPQRSIGALREWFGTTTPSPLSSYPIWKVHRYSGIQLRPVRPEDHHHHEETAAYDVYDPRETVEEEEEEAPSIIKVPESGGSPNTNEIISQEHQSHDNDESQIDLSTLESYEPITALLNSKDEQIKQVLGALGLARSDQQAEERIGLVGRLIKRPLKKKKKALIALAVLGKLLKKLKATKLIKGSIALKGLAAGGVVKKVAIPKIVYPITSALYRKIPETFPAKPSILSKLPIIGSHFVPKGVPIKLPDPILPEIPGLSLVPEAPKLPHLYLSGPYKVPYSSGSYVSIRVPTPPQVDEHLTSNYGPPSVGSYTPPATSYGVPFETPTIINGASVDNYPSPRDPVYPEYGVPSQQASQLYNTPYQQQVSQFNAPATDYQQPLQYNTPSTDYQQQVPQYSAPVADYQQQVPQYSAPVADYQQQVPQYSAPVADYQQQVPQYSAPVADYQQPAQQYGAPATDYQQPTQQYSATEQIQSPQYNSPNILQTQNAYPAQKKFFNDEDSAHSDNSWQGIKEIDANSSRNDEEKKNK